MQSAGQRDEPIQSADTKRSGEDFTYKFNVQLQSILALEFR